jgi:hypothetical protein
MKVLGLETDLPLVRRDERNRIEAKTQDDWYLFLYGLLRCESIRSRWWVPDPQTFH